MTVYQYSSLFEDQVMALVYRADYEIDRAGEWDYDLEVTSCLLYGPCSSLVDPDIDIPF